MTSEVAFRFNSQTHEYTALDSGEVLPHITGMIERCGWDPGSRFYTEESRQRGTAVHQMTSAFDLGSLEPEDLPALESPYKGYLLAHVAAINQLRPAFDGIEEPDVHPVHRYGGRPDRTGRVFALQAVIEGKSGPEAKSHQIQTALQAILRARHWHLSPEHVGRFCLYWQANGRFKLIEHKRRQDFDEARRIIKVCCS